MKKLTLLFLILAVLMISGCNENKKDGYPPEAENDKIYTTIGGKKNAYQTKAGLHRGDGYTLALPVDTYRYEKDYDDGNLEEKWEHKKKENVQITVTTYKNTDAIEARSKFLRENDDYIFEDLMGYSLCGIEPDGDVLWFNLHESNSDVFIISWEYPKNTSEELQKELSTIAQTFKLEE